MTLNGGLAYEIQQLAPTALIELYILDATAIGGEILYFHNGTNQLQQNIVFQGQTYVRFPIMATGFEFTGQGQIPRPKLVVSNLLSAVTTILLATNDLLGAKITRKRTFARYLDAVNFPGGTNPSADIEAEFQNDIYFIDRKSREDKDSVEFELASALDLVGVNLPRRQVIQNTCIWGYRSSECGYSGAPLFTINDEAIPTTGQSAEAQAVLSTYAAYTEAQTELDEAEAALSAATRARDAACEYIRLSTNYTDGGNAATVTYGVVVFRNNGTKTAYYNGVVVSLGLIYRQGKLRHQYGSQTLNLYNDTYEIEVWGIDSGTCDPEQDAYEAALAARDAAQTARDSALSDFETAFGALPDDDPLHVADRCGKRLTSCELRFGENNPLPYGAFPGADLIK